MRDTHVEYAFTRGCLIGNMGAELADHSAMIRAQVDTSLAEWSESIADSIRAAQASGELTAGGDPERLSRFILNAWEGALLRAKVVKNSEPLDDFFAVVFEDILR
jgi:TetR/AcrR family transcriptional repressor of nem operon